MHPKSKDKTPRHGRCQISNPTARRRWACWACDELRSLKRRHRETQQCGGGDDDGPTVTVQVQVHADARVHLLRRDKEQRTQNVHQSATPTHAGEDACTKNKNEEQMNEKDLHFLGSGLFFFGVGDVRIYLRGLPQNIVFPGGVHRYMNLLGRVGTDSNQPERK